MENVVVFLDFANIEASAPGRINYGDLRSYLGEGRFLLESFAYVPIDPRSPNAREGLIHHLQKSGWAVTPKMGKVAGSSYKANVDVEMTIDIIQIIARMRPDILVLCSGDGDFLPLIRFLRKHGIRIEAAAFRCAAAREVQDESSGFIDLNLWYGEQSRGFLSCPPMAEDPNMQASGCLHSF